MDREKRRLQDEAITRLVQSPEARGWQGSTDEGIECLINAFVAEVERRAEDKMMKTGKLEGAHYAALKQLQREINGS